MNKFLYLAVIVPGMMLTGCHEDAEQLAEPITENLPVYLTDQDGNPVTQIDGTYGTYLLHVTGLDAWQVESDQDFLHPSQTQGTGDAVITVQAGTCWGYRRNATLTVRSLGANASTTRGDGEGATTTLINVAQAPAIEASQLTRLGSNIGIGYSYNPMRADDPLLAVGQPVFDIKGLYDDGVILDDFLYEQTETYFLADSEAKLHQQLDLSAGLSLNIGSIAVSGSGSYGHIYDTNSDSWHCMMQNRTKFYQRDFNYLDELASTTPHLSVGFKASQSKLEATLNVAKTPSEVTNALLGFLDQYGPYFIYRAQLGVELDYTGTISKQVEKDSTAVKAALKFKWKREVATQPSQGKSDGGGIDIDAYGEYQKKIDKMVSNTSTRLDVKGGNNSINILANGGKLTIEELTAWQLDVNLDNAVLVGFAVAPIYCCFDNYPLSYKYLKQYINEGGKIEKL